MQNKQRGILSATLHTFIISPQHLQETPWGDVLYLQSFKKINLLLTYCLPESTLLLPVSPAHPTALAGGWAVRGPFLRDAIGWVGCKGNPWKRGGAQSLAAPAKLWAPSSAWALLCSCPISLSASKPRAAQQGALPCPCARPPFLQTRAL